MSKKSIVTIVILIVVIAVVGIVSGYFILTNDGPYTGVVTLADTGEPVEGVSVSDGRNVVKTDADGQFTLNGWRKAHFITVTAPAGYWTEDYYIPVDKKTASYNFTLENQK